MARRRKPNATEFLEKGTAFFNSLNQTLGSAKELFSIFYGSQQQSNNTNSNNNTAYDVNNEDKIKASSYRFMKLQPGCGSDEVKKRFRVMVKEKRPDLDEGDDKTKWFMALQVARETLLKYEK